jgi:hypothetical protein
MHEKKFNFNLRITLTSISIPNHISNGGLGGLSSCLLDLGG